MYEHLLVRLHRSRGFGDDPYYVMLCCDLTDYYCWPGISCYGTINGFNWVLYESGTLKSEENWPTRFDLRCLAFKLKESFILSCFCSFYFLFFFY